MELFNAEQSTTDCIRGECHDASNAIDGDMITWSIAEPAMSSWLQVSMANITVYQIVLSAGTDSKGVEITVSLYSGETLAGQCQSHTGGFRSTQTLSCDRVAADRVMLTMNNTQLTYLYVTEIKVYGNNTGYNITRCSITKLSSKPLKNEKGKSLLS